MKTFILLAWRNLWRNVARSLIMIAGVSVGLFGLLIYYGISNGFIDEIVETSIRLDLAHVQLTREGYHKNPMPKNSFQADSSLLGRIESAEGVQTAAPRFSAGVLVNSAGKSRRVDLAGIEPEREKRVTAVASDIERGEYLHPGDDRRILIGGRLAEALGVDLGDKVVVMAQDRNNELQSYLLRVGGIFNTSSAMFDKNSAFVTLETMWQLMGRNDEYTAVLIRARENLMADQVADAVAAKITGGRLELEVRTWKEVSPLLSETINMFNSFVWIFYLIIYLAMAFGVINIMLMAVLDRTRELGIMRALGTTPRQVMGLVLLEAAFLGLAGIVVGGGAAWLLNGYLSTHGLDLSYWSGAMDYMGIANVVHSSIRPGEWVISFVSAEAAVVLSSLWPAVRAFKLSPVEAIQFE